MNAIGMALMVWALGYFLTLPACADLMDLVVPVSNYKIFVTKGVNRLVEQTAAFTAAVRAGDLKKAQALYAPTQVQYETIEPIAELFNDLDTRIDSRADDHEKREADPGFIGFHRLEFGLFEKRSADGLAPLADKLDHDVVKADGTPGSKIPYVCSFLSSSASGTNCLPSGYVPGTPLPPRSPTSSRASRTVFCRTICTCF